MITAEMKQNKENAVEMSEQISCVQMEVERRERVMPIMVREGRMTADRSAAEIARMKAVLKTLANIGGIQVQP